MKKIKKIYAALLSMVLMLLSTGNVLAAEAVPQNEETCFVRRNCTFGE